MDITNIKQALADNALSVAQHLLPNGKKESSEWRCGSVTGEAGKSLGVHLFGGKAGVWADFQSGEGGDLLDLWVKVRGVALSEALQEASNWLGVVQPTPSLAPKKSYTRPQKPKCVVPQAKVKDYLCEVRNIPGHILDAYQVGERDGTIVFPFLLPDGALAMAKERKAEDGAKPKPTAENCEPILFGWQAVPTNAREVVITEGEIDALSWATYGWPAMSVPFGGGGGKKQQWIENDFDRMAQFERIYLATDMDKPGDEAALAIADRLGHHRCFRVSMPKKDGNACLVDGIPKGDMDAAIRKAAPMDPEGLRRPMHFVDDVIGLFWPAPGEHVGYLTPYGKLGTKLLFRPAEMTLWSGASGAGKSQVLSDCAVDWVKQGSRICISSLEMRAASTLKRMCKQASGIDRPEPDEITAALSWLERGILLYDVVGKANVDQLIKVFDYARGRYGCDQFIVDSLMRLGVASDDYVGQEKAVFKLVDWAVSQKVHLHVVAHARKAGIQGGAPETEDVKGAMEIGANAFNIVTVWRNRELEDEIKKLEAQALAIQKEDPKKAELLSEGVEKKKKEPGVLLNVAKQRNGDFEGKVRLWFDKNTYRYYSTHDRINWCRTYVEQSPVIKLRAV